MKKSGLTPEQALTRLMDLCSRTEKSAAEVREKLRQWGLEKHQDTIVEKLTSARFLDENRFAGAFVRDKIRFNKWGKIKIGWMLKKHEIPGEIIASAIESYDQEEYKQLVFSELKKKHNSLKKLSGYTLKGRLSAFAQQRGYEHELVHAYFESAGI